MYQHRDAIIRSRSIQRNVDPTHQSSYYVAITDMIKILNINVIKMLTWILIFNILIISVSVT
jgi:hypothetical protein